MNKFYYVIFVLFSVPVLAVPGIPQQFYGNIAFNGFPASNGTLVTAEIDNVQVASEITTNGLYGYPPDLFYVNDPNNDRAGKVIMFFVNGQDTGITYNFSNGGSTRIDMNIAGSPDMMTLSCIEKWICNDWSSCDDGKKYRSCMDLNGCNKQNNAPETSTSCNQNIASADIITDEMNMEMLRNGLFFLVTMAILAEAYSISKRQGEEKIGRIADRIEHYRYRTLVKREQH